ncbi:hypothetical protein [Oscillatoria salina]|uniref:hypothetical protein n=1 Tax=Oscillatoria salina TaxID=331517 RepID=UPI001CCF2B78|nr:hypothetical protein [Oscillatoria salina]MBZ8181337.1 hypothetical protein [Oscillatoria salina IIICB1]
MLQIGELKQTKAYQEAYKKGFKEGFREGFRAARIQTKLDMIPKLRKLDWNAEEIAEFLELNLDIIRQHF